MNLFFIPFLILAPVFPFLSLAMFYLCWRLLFFKIKYNKTNNKDWLNLYQFWIKIFIFCLFFCCLFFCFVLLFFMEKPDIWTFLIFGAFAVLALLGLCWRLLYFKIKYSETNNKDWLNLYQFWIKIFIFCLFFCCLFFCFVLLCLAAKPDIWAFLIFGAFAGIFALALLAPLGIMLFGINRVSNNIHTLATFLVAVVTTILFILPCIMCSIFLLLVFFAPIEKFPN